MGQAKSRGLLAFSVILALGSASGWSKPALPERPLRNGTLEGESGKGEAHGKDALLEKVSAEGRKSESGAANPGQGNLKPDPQPVRQEAEEEDPAQEEKSDCDDCVIVRSEAPEVPSEVPEGKTAGSSGMSGSAHLAGTLWGLFMVARPKRMPRTIIRGVTVP